MQNLKSQLSKLIGFMNRSDGTLKGKAVRSGLWLGISGMMVNVLTFIRSVVLARILTPDIFGLMALGLIVIRILDTVTRSGVAEALVHRKDNIEEARDTVFSVLIMRGFVLAGLLALVAPFAADFYEEPVLTGIIIVLGLSLPVHSFSNINTILKSKELDFKRLAYLDQLGELANTVVVITMAIVLKSVWALVIGHVAAAASYMLLSYVLIPGRPRFRFNYKLAVELFSYGKFITGVSIVLFIAGQIDTAVIGKMLGIEQLGYYSLALTTASFATVYIAKLSSRILFPAYSKLQDDQSAVCGVYVRVFELLNIVLIPATLGISLLAYEIILMLYGEKWLPAAEILKILAVFGLFRALAAANGNLFNGIGKPNIDFRIALARLCLILIIIYPLILYFGLIGAALSVTLPMIFQWLIGLLALKKIAKLRLLELVGPSARIVWRCGVMVMVVLLGKHFLDLANPAYLIILIALSTVVYGVLAIKPALSLLRGDT